MPDTPVKKTVTIIVNGTAEAVSKEKITYSAVVTLAFPDFAQHPEISYSVTFTKGPNDKHEGTLSPGGSVNLKEGMEFRVSRTGQS